MTTLSRRKFLRLTAFAMLVGTGSAAGIYQAATLPLPKLSDAVPEPLSDNVLDTLVAAAEGLAEVPISASIYRQLFSWKAENQAGYADLYQDFAAYLEDKDPNFANAALEKRIKIMADIVDIFDIEGVAALSANLIQRDHLLYARFILTDIIKLFVKTDLLLQLGYDNYPGVPRGFDFYQSLPMALTESSS